jgi:hypothetical protein
MNNTGFLGIVERGELQPLAGEKVTAVAPLRLTRLPLDSERPPESEEIALDAYEGRAILVRGVDRNGWLYSAVWIDESGPIVSAVVRQLFNMTGRDTLHRLHRPALGS